MQKDVRGGQSENFQNAPRIAGAVSNVSHSSIVDSAVAIPPCPITGEPAVALVQTVRCEFLARLWEIEFKVNARPSFGGASHLSLWRSPTGLLFFSPALVGDADFYKTFYKTLGPKLFPREDRPRARSF